jgi:hypothetical protein
MMASLQASVGTNYILAHLCDKFASGIHDSVWIPQIGQEGQWIVVSGDRAKNSSGSGKLPALCIEHKVSALMMSSSFVHKKSHEKLKIFQDNWGQVVNIANFPPGSLFLMRYRENSISIEQR